MSTNTYKGFPIPEIMPDSRLFYIICEQGVFDGFSEDAVLEKWKNKVDFLLKQDALDGGYVEISDTVLGCNDCGSLVWDVYSHKIFHNDLTS